MNTPHEIAAVLLGAKPSDNGRLHHDLYDLLTDVDAMVCNAGGELCSRQAIAIIIAIWRRQNPTKTALGE